MAFRILSPDAVQRLMDYRNNKVPPPLKIVEHKQRIELAEQEASRTFADSGRIAMEMPMRIAKMCMELDALYCDWAEGVERLRWIDIPQKQDVTVEDILREAVWSTEAIGGETGVEILAEFLDMNGYTSLFSQLVEKYLLEVRPYVEEVLPLKGEVAEILADPRKFLPDDDDKTIALLIINRFGDTIGMHSHPRAQLAWIAHVEQSLGHYRSAIQHAGFAYCEAHVKHFGEKFTLVAQPEASAALIEVEKRKAEILIELFREREKV
ncbi:MAG: hypothetical protein V4436_00235 [Patescibacteria group bacterium]